MNRTANTRRSQRGFTFIELCVGLGICTALLSQGVPALTKMRQQQSLRVTAQALAGDLRLARSEAVRTSDSVFFRVSEKGAQACYVLYTGPRNECDCSGGQAACKSSAGSVIKAEWLPTGQPLRLRSNAETLEFQHRQGLVTQTGSIEVALDDGPGIRQVIAITGRVRSCAIGAKMFGLSKCA